MEQLFLPFHKRRFPTHHVYYRYRTETAKPIAASFTNELILSVNFAPRLNLAPLQPMAEGYGPVWSISTVRERHSLSIKHRHTLLKHRHSN
jgi:hypothetical protein